MTRRAWAVGRLVVGACIVTVIAVRLGTGPFVTGVRSIGPGSVLVACALAGVTTVCCAWRWWLVARGLDVPLRYPTAVAAYYRSQFLNLTLPGGVLGDLHRGVRHGRDAGDLGRGLRAVFWERSAGQLLQAGCTVPVLAVLASPVRSAAVLVLLTGVLGALALAAVWRVAGTPRARNRWARAVGADVRAGVLARRVWPGVLGCSLVAHAGHLVTFLVAARAVGASAPPGLLLALALLVLLAAAIPTNLGGWGPREGAAAWAFSAAGLTAAQGVAAAAAYGVLVTAASLPGAVVLAVDAAGHRRRRAPSFPVHRQAVLATEAALDG